EPGHDEGTVRDTVDRPHARPDRAPENDEVERRRQDGRGDALRHGAEGPRHLEPVDGLDRVDVHTASFPCTSPTKISSSELSLVCRSLNAIPSSPTRRSTSGMPVAWTSKV